MTDEQIKYNAGKYASFGKDAFQTEEKYIQLRNAYIAGAHSRDEEVDELQGKVEAMESYIEAEKACMQEELYEMQEQLKMNAEGFQRLRAELKKAQNPWVSVKERLPEKTKGTFSCEVRELEKDKVVYYKDTRGYIHTGYLNAKNHWRDLDRDNAAIFPVTHWMPIPEGGEK